MHVSSRALLAAAAVLGACDSSAQATPSPAVSTSASAPAAAPDPAFLALAVRARDDATKVAKECILQRAHDYHPPRPIVIEHCSGWRREHVEAVRDSAAALRAYPSVPRTGPAASFVEEVRLFAEFVVLVQPLVYRRGTLRHYQELAVAWNAWRPEDKIVVDAGRLPSSWKGPFSARLVWEKCAGGPCVALTEDR